MKSALAIGGANALRTSENLHGPTAAATATTPISNATRDNRQHAWDDFVERDEGSETDPPRHHLLLLTDYVGTGEPSPTDRRTVEGALRQLEAAFEWRNRGLLFTVGYSPTYFDRFDESLPSGVDLRTAAEVIDAVRVDDEEPEPEPFEVVIHLASDNAVNLLTAEQALWGFPEQDRDTANGVRFEHTLEGVFEKPTGYPARRTGYVGAGMPKRNVGEDVDDDLAEEIHGDAPLSMGFDSGFEDNLPDETGASILHDQTLAGEFERPGAFAQGSIQHVSKLNLDLDAWYGRSKRERIERMFSPHHAESDVGEVGENFDSSTDTDAVPMRDRRDADLAERTQRDADERGIVGHTQKLARARFDLDLRRDDPDPDGSPALEPTILRRDFDTTDEGRPGVHFVALMRFNGYMVYTRAAMNGVEFDSEELIPPEPGETDGSRIVHDDVDLPVENDGFLRFITALRRGNFLVPPLELRALPPARAIRPDIDVDVTQFEAIRDDLIPVVVRRTESFDPTALDLATVRFGPLGVVDTGGGATPVNGGHPVNGDAVETADLLLRFPADEAGFDEGSSESRLFGKTAAGLPVQSTAEMVIHAS